jgi:hypothetical protein
MPVAVDDRYLPCTDASDYRIQRYCRFGEESGMPTRKSALKVFASVALVLATTLSPITASVAHAQVGRSAGVSVPVTGTVDGVQTVIGTFNIQRFAKSEGEIVAVGTLVASLPTPGGALRTVVTPLSMTLERSASIAAANNVSALAVCEVLNLVLGPLDLNLLGLAVHLDQVVLDITAVSGAGNLVGNLLCAITGLLDGAGPLGQVVALLNGLLGLLG